MCEKKIKKSLFGFILIPLLSLIAATAGSVAPSAPTANAAGLCGGVTATYKLSDDGKTVSEVRKGQEDNPNATGDIGACLPINETNNYTWDGETLTFARKSGALACSNAGKDDTLVLGGAPAQGQDVDATVTRGSFENNTCTQAKDNVNVAVGENANVDALVAAAQKLDEEGADPPSSCAIPGVGWLVCNVANFIAGLVDGLYGYISDTFLSTDAGLVSNDSQTRTAWASLLGLANVIFVIIFLVIIFSQATGYGISNYGIKKMLPKIIVGVILINISYYICQAAVDISNLFGYGFTDLFEGLAPKQNIATSWVDITTTILALGLTGGGIAVAALGFGLSFALLCLLTVIFIAIVLIIQKVLIVVCVIFSPIAFAAWLLPNTEKLFKSWWKIFYAMLIVFPLTSLVLGASSLASDVIVNSMSSASINAGTDNADNQQAGGTQT